MIELKEYCPHCGEVTPSKIYKILGADTVYCAVCHKFIEIIYDDDEEGY